MLFAAATPAAALATTGLLSLSPWRAPLHARSALHVRTQADPDVACRASAPAGAALCVIFSGGTFCYAACVHVLPSALGTKAVSSSQLAVLLAGSILPLALVSIVGHGH